MRTAKQTITKTTFKGKTTTNHNGVVTQIETVDGIKRYHKSILTNKQQKVRAKNKLAKQSRKANRK